MNLHPAPYAWRGLNSLLQMESPQLSFDPLVVDSTALTLYYPFLSLYMIFQINKNIDFKLEGKGL